MTREEIELLMKHATAEDIVETLSHYVAQINQLKAQVLRLENMVDYVQKLKGGK